MTPHEDGLKRFRDEVESQLPSLLDELLACPIHRRGVAAAPHSPGIYLYSEQDTPLYVGRTRNLSRRWANHTQPSCGINSAAFAFNIARRELAAQGVNLNRGALSDHPDFADAFRAAKARVRAMDYRFARVDSPLLSTVGEVYVAMLLGTEGDFNAFETH